MGALHALGGAADDGLAGTHRAGEGHHAHQRVRYQRAADGRAASEDDIDHARRQQLIDELGQAQGGQRGLFGGLEDHGVAGGERRAELPGRHHQGVVPGRDGGDHADRVAADHRGEARQVFPGRRTGKAAAGAGEEAEHIGYGGKLVVQCGGVGFAAVVGLQLRQLFGVRFDAVGKLEQQGGAVPRGGPRPAFEGRIGGTHRGVHLGFAGFGNLHQHRAGGRVEHVQGFAFAGGELAVDQQFGLHGSVL
ncbi:hypothetical protein D9M68_619040 [compost metagenome]